MYSKNIRRKNININIKSIKISRGLIDKKQKKWSKEYRVWKPISNELIWDKIKYLGVVLEYKLNKVHVLWSIKFGQCIDKTV